MGCSANKQTTPAVQEPLPAAPSPKKVPVPEAINEAFSPAPPEVHTDISSHLEVAAHVSELPVTVSATQQSALSVTAGDSMVTLDPTRVYSDLLGTRRNSDTEVILCADNDHTHGSLSPRPPVVVERLLTPKGDETPCASVGLLNYGPLTSESAFTEVSLPEAKGEGRRGSNASNDSWFAAPLREAAMGVAAPRASNIDNLRKGKKNVLLLCIREGKNQRLGEVCLTGAVSEDGPMVRDLYSTLSRMAKSEQAVTQRYRGDQMWDIVWEGTGMTTASQGQRDCFPMGKNIVDMLDVVAKHGWVPSAGAKYRGIGDGGVAQSTITFKVDKGMQHLQETLFIAVSNAGDGKLCAAGPPDVISALRISLTARLQEFDANTAAKFDSSETSQAWDIVWQPVSVTSQSDVEGKACVPKGSCCMAILEEVYKLGWHIVADTSFATSPCFIFKRWKEPPTAVPPIIMAAYEEVGDSGKLCIAGSRTQNVAHRILEAVHQVRDHKKAGLQKHADRDWDEVLSNIRLTEKSNGYFPRNDVIQAVLSITAHLGWGLIACPNFSQATGSCVSFIWEWQGHPRSSVFVAFSDMPFRVAIGGGDGSAREDLLSGLQDLVTPRPQQISPPPPSFDLSQVNTVIGNSKGANGGPRFPLEMILIELGFQFPAVPTILDWAIVGGPSFDCNGVVCPSIVLESQSKQASGDTGDKQIISNYSKHRFEGSWWDASEQLSYHVVSHSDGKHIRAFGASCCTLLSPKMDDGYEWLQGDELHASGNYRRKLCLRIDERTGTMVQRFEQQQAWSTPRTLIRPTNSARTRQAKYLSLDSLWDDLVDGHTILIRGSWLVKWSQTGKPLPRRQDLPSEAAWDVAELRLLVEKFEVFMMALSYCWEAPEQPDASGEKMQTLAHLLKQRLAMQHRDGPLVSEDAAIFFDWCSLHQKERGPEEYESYRHGLRNCHLWYAHASVEAWLLTYTPDGVLPCDRRGWPTFEKAISSMIKPEHMLLEINQQAAAAEEWTQIYESSKAGRSPPKAPAVFNEELEAKLFSDSEDREMVTEMYKTTFEQVLAGVIELAYTNLSWGDPETLTLAGVLPHCLRVQKVDINSNMITAAGAGPFLHAAAQCPTLELVSFTKNPLGDAGAIAMAPSLRNFSSLKTLWLNDCGIGDEGAMALVDQLPLCTSIRNFYFFDNAATDEAAKAIAEVLPLCPHLFQFGIGGNNIGPQKLAQLEEAWSSVKREEGHKIFIR